MEYKAFSKDFLSGLSFMSWRRVTYNILHFRFDRQFSFQGFFVCLFVCFWFLFFSFVAVFCFVCLFFCFVFVLFCFIFLK